MTRYLWGAFDETDDTSANNLDNYVQISTKRAKLDEIEMQERANPPPESEISTLKIKNSLVTQTIEVMKQTEMLQSLIDTYSNKSGTSNYLLNPCQMIPEVDFPEENAADLVNDEKFQKPIWFIPTLNTPFARGDPEPYPQLNGEICRSALRKAACGQLRVAGFTDTAESALILFADVIEEFIRHFVSEIRDASNSNMNTSFSNTNYCTEPDPHRFNKERELQVMCVERAYHAVTNSSLTQVHNFYKHNLIARNRSEVAEFRSVKQEYDKLMEESQSMQKEEEDFQDQDFLNILEMTPVHSEDTIGSTISNAATIVSNNGNSNSSTINEVMHDLSSSNSNEMNTMLSNGNVSNGPIVNHIILENGHATSNGASNSSNSSSSSTSLSMVTHNGTYQPGYD